MSKRVWNNYQEFIEKNRREDDHFEKEFETLGELGKGDFGEVREVTIRGEMDAKNPPKFAVKLINVNSLNSLDAALNEVMVLKDIPPHQNVMKVHSELSWYTAPKSLKSDHILKALKTAQNLKCDGMKFYTVMEYLPIQLTEETAETDDMNTLWNRIKSLTAGLHHLHQHGIFHGDLKPNNLCLRNKDEIVLIDFGMSGTGSMKITGFLTMSRRAVVDDITFLANAYRAAHPHTP